jgi:hypothetical protein
MKNQGENQGSRNPSVLVGFLRQKKGLCIPSQDSDLLADGIGSLYTKQDGKNSDTIFCLKFQILSHPRYCLIEGSNFWSVTALQSGAGSVCFWGASWIQIRNFFVRIRILPSTGNLISAV